MFGFGFDDPAVRRGLLAFVIAVALLTLGVSVFG